MPQTLLDKIWNSHIVARDHDSPAILYIDRHLFHEVTSPQAFDELRKRGLKVRRQDKTFGVVDHSIPTTDRDKPSSDPIAQKQIETAEINAKEFDVEIHGGIDPYQGVIHVTPPEIGVIQPGMTVVCGDSHTATHGAFGALAFGIGTSEVGHVFATQCLLQYKPKSFEVILKGEFPNGVTPKDVILALIAKYGVGGGTGGTFEFRGPAVKNISMEGRMTICNMAIEGGARSGMFAPDDITFDYLKDREYSPKGDEWEQSLERWQTYTNDEDAVFDKTFELDISTLEPMVTYGTNPGMGVKISENIPRPEDIENPEERAEVKGALAYMDLKPGQPVEGIPIEYVFLGSCTNGRLEDFRAAAGIIKGKKIADGLTALAVPGSYNVKKQAEAESLDKIFREAGFEWREPGCSMCLAMNPDKVPAGKRCASTSNRNFRGRQGPGSRTHLMSPIMAAAAAIEGEIVDVRGNMG